MAFFGDISYGKISFNDYFKWTPLYLPVQLRSFGENLEELVNGQKGV